MKRIVTVVIIFAIASLVAAQQIIDAAEMYTKAAALTKLTAAVQAFVRYEGASDDLTEVEVLRLATKHDPGLLTNLAPFRLRVMRQDRHASVLVCTVDGARGLLEDVGCTARLDRHLWQSPKSEPCEFTITISEVC